MDEVDKLARAPAVESVRYCLMCRTKTWHMDGVCEWSDGHKSQEDRPHRDATFRD
jgi:hypothetical protein